MPNGIEQGWDNASRTVSRWLAPLLTVAALLCLPAAAGAATITVNGLTDDDPTTGEIGPNADCTLREAIHNARHDTSANNCAAGNGNDVILLPSGRIELDEVGVNEAAGLTGDLDVTASAANGTITIRGKGIDKSIVDANGIDRVFEISSFTGLPRHTLEGLTVTNGVAPAATPDGGGIAIYDDGLLRRVRITGNDAGTNGEGGGIHRNSAGGASPDNIVTIERSVISGNDALSSNSQGGGVYLTSGTTAGDAVIRSTTISGNRALESAGGIGITRGKVSVIDSTISGNSVIPAIATDPGSGAGIRVYSSGTDPARIALTRVRITGNSVSTSGQSAGGGIAIATPSTVTSTITGSTISGNTLNGSSAQEGAGLEVDPPAATPVKLNVEGSTISGNRALGAGASRGGGIAIDTTDLLLRNSTVSGNSAATGGGLYQTGGVGSATIQFSTFARNTAGFGPGVSQGGSTLTLRGTLIDQGATGCDGAVSTLGHNLDRGSSCLPAPAAGDKVNANPRLASLSAANGGPTATHRLLNKSAAINAVPKSACGAAGGADQRNFIRPGGGRCDIGAYELHRCAGRAANRVGTKGRNRLKGTKRADVIAGLGGNDVLLGLGGNDLICGGPGNDKLVGAKGRDRLLGQAGRDRLLGGPGRDFLIGGPGRDRLRGGPGRDRERQ